MDEEEAEYFPCVVCHGAGELYDEDAVEFLNPATHPPVIGVCQTCGGTGETETEGTW